MKKRILLIPLLLIAALGCKKQEGMTVEEYNSNYFVFEEGHHLTYAVSEIYYDDFFTPVKIDTVNYFLKVVIDSVFIDTDGEQVAVIDRQKKTDTTNWTISDKWLVRGSNTHLEFVEENVGYIKLVYPPRFGKKWDGNARNVLPSQLYTVVSDQSSYQLNNIIVNNIVIVEQKRNLNLIEDELQEEWFSEGIGLIYKIDRNLRLTIDGQIESGHIIEYKLTDYGYQ